MAILLLLVFIFWLPLLRPGRAPFLRDLSSEIIPKRMFWADSRGFALWDRYAFFGMPYAANPQSEAFYPLNVFYLVFPAQRAVGYYMVFHHLLFILTLYPALRGLGFRSGSSFVCAIGFGFGGYLISLSLLMVLLSTFAWLPLLIIFLQAAVKKKWFLYSLLLGLVMTVQFLAGEVEIAAMSWALALCAVVFSPQKRRWPKDLAKALAALAFGLAWSLVLALPQVMLSRELIPISNRSQGMGISEALIWSLKYYGLKSIFLPNYVLPITAHHLSLHWGLGFFSGFSYLFSYYAGITLLLAMAPAFIDRKGLRAWWWLSFVFFSALLLFLYLFKPGELKDFQGVLNVLCWAGGAVLLVQMAYAFIDPERFKVWFWGALFFGGLLLAMGESMPFYKFLHGYLPGFQLFRIPDKFYLFCNFSVMVLAGYGMEALALKKFSHNRLAVLLILCGAAIGLVLVIYPMRAQELGNRYDQIVEYLAIRSILRVSALGLVMAGLLILVSGRGNNRAGILAGLLIFADLYIAHHRLNPPVMIEFYRPNDSLVALAAKEKDRITPVRVLTLLPDVQEMILKRVMDPIEFYSGIKDTLEPYWALYYGLNDVRAVASFYVSDYTRFANLRTKEPPVWGKMVTARSGIEYFYFKKKGFFEISGKFSRAMVFYRAKTAPDNDEISMVWSDPNFPARMTLLLEGRAGEMKSAPELLISDPAKIVKYENEKVVVEAEAKRDGWLLLLDSYYPGWKAEVDGRQVEIFRANGFFRAVKIPAGRHVITFSYFPDIFRKSLYVSGAGFLVWLALIAYSLAISARRRV